MIRPQAYQEHRAGDALIGIYEIVNVKDGKASSYVGSSINIEKRWREHRSALHARRHDNIHLQHAWDKWGENAFVFSILEEVSEGHLMVMEQEYLDHYFHRGSCYNIAITAGPVGPLSEETRQRISQGQKGNKRGPLSEEHKQKLSATTKAAWIRGVYNNRATKEFRHKLSEGHQGQIPWNAGKKRGPQTQEWRHNIGEGLKTAYAEGRRQRPDLRGERNPNWRKKMSEEQKSKISETLKGRQLTEEHRHNISRGLKKYWASKEST